METLDRDTLNALLTTQNDGPCLSIYVPTEEVGPEAIQGSIRLKNLLLESERKLQGLGWSAKQIQSFLKPARELVNDTLFWKHQQSGLVILLAPGVFRHFRLPIHVQEMASVGQRFYMKPLLRLLSTADQFYVLALSQQHVRLLLCTPHSFNRVELPDAPENIDEVLKYDDPEKQVHFHTEAPPAGASGYRAAVSYGHGDENYEQRETLRRYFRAVDRVLCKTVENHDIPLVFAGVNYLFAIYREVSRYNGLIGDIVEGNPEPLSDQQLQKKAWKTVQPVFAKRWQQQRERYHDLSGTGLAADNIEEIVLAARDGRVDTLFLAAETSLPGVIDHEANTVAQNADSTDASEDLLDYAAVQTYLHRGAVHPVETDEVPGGGWAAAIYRY